MSRIVEAEQLLALLRQVLGGLVDELVTEKLAAMPQRQVVPAETTPAWKRVHVSMSEAAESLGVCTATLYRMQREGELTLTKLRRRTFVPVAELERLRASHEQSLAPAPQPEPPKPARVKKRHLVPRE